MRSKGGKLAGEYVRYYAGVGRASAVTFAAAVSVTVRRKIVCTLLWVLYVQR